jgi:GDSL-like lipase/acylhydrolase family protein
MSHHIVLLGDSIFDNQTYTAGEPDVVTHLSQLLPSPWQATLCAVDGATTNELKAQCPGVPPEASHLVVSIGGNDAIMNSDLLATPVASTAESLALFGERVSVFESQYRAALGEIQALGRPVTTCTIYNGCFPPDQAETTRVALMIFNDVILRVAFEHQFAVIDLRLVCSDPADYANPIEPSGTGGHKIAEAITRAVGVADSASAHSRVFAG